MFAPGASLRQKNRDLAGEPGPSRLAGQHHVIVALERHEFGAESSGRSGRPFDRICDCKKSRTSQGQIKPASKTLACGAAILPKRKSGAQQRRD